MEDLGKGPHSLSSSLRQDFLLGCIVLCVVNRVFSPAELMEIIQFRSLMGLNQKNMSVVTEVSGLFWPSWPCANWD